MRTQQCVDAIGNHVLVGVAEQSVIGIKIGEVEFFLGVVAGTGGNGTVFFSGSLRATSIGMG